MKKKVKVKIVAIAKDEAAYLPEWIFHHLYFGADAIDIYINRTTDNSIEILEKIQTHYPQVNFYSADWVDMLEQNIRSHLQYMVYSFAFQDEKMKKDFSHLFFIDIDEFWTPKDLKTLLPDFINTLPRHASVSFGWFMMHGEEKSFAFLEDTIFGEKSPSVKSIIQLNSKIKKMRIHIPLFDTDENKRSILADGVKFRGRKIAKKLETLHSSLTERDQDVIIIHRILRSEKEYLSLLLRQNVEQKFMFKNTRTGFSKNLPRQSIIRFPKEAYSEYEKERELFFNKVKIDSELEKARQFVLNRLSQVTCAIEAAPTEQEDIMKKIFQGITDQSVLASLNKFYERVREEKEK